MDDTVEQKHVRPSVDAEARAQEAFINPSGHPQELDRNFSLVNICGLGLTSGNTWIALGGTIVC